MRSLATTQCKQTCANPNFEPPSFRRGSAAMRDYMAHEIGYNAMSGDLYETLAGALSINVPETNADSIKASSGLVAGPLVPVFISSSTEGMCRPSNVT